MLMNKTVKKILKNLTGKITTLMNKTSKIKNQLCNLDLGR